jgi:hypothetical protein
MPFRVPLHRQKRQKDANGRKRWRTSANAKSLRLRLLSAQSLQPLEFAKSRSKTPTLFAMFQIAIS